ncbi:UDP-glucosyltransferase 2-like [Stomoxys calcitrans]|uniref:UDP-glucosyltransferase 2-like n=1 Tax=Stomoxys calcitrans TaxID=35570 RepID=UPI0027E31706|nr:UDP-glucosyltransferase 2-like [Stomoxys calcitrans]
MRISQVLSVLQIGIFVSLHSLSLRVEGAKILAVFAFPGPSQYILVQPYLKQLASRGHEVTVVNAFPQKEKVKNFRDVPVLEVHDNYAAIIANAQVQRNCWQDMTFLSGFCCNITETVLKNSEVQNLLKNEHFDLIILEVIHTDALYSLGRHFAAPMIGLSSFGTDIIIDELMGNISPLAYAPQTTIGYTEHMSYKERLHNAFSQLLELLHVRLVHLPRQRQILKKYLPHINADIWDLRTNFSLMLLNQHFSLSFPRPYVPNMVEVGGLQLQHSSKPLPLDMQQFINSSNEDVIYFSMGSNLKSKDFPPKQLKMIVETFRKLPYKILWKFEDPQLEGKPKNVFISSWYPQPDVLAHPRVKLFISHGGLLSTTESVSHGKPMLGLPMFYDQMMNIEKAKQSGFALSLDFNSMERQDFEQSIREMMTNRRYSNKAKEISRLYHDKPMKAMDLAIYWTEYVLRHHGAVHLQNRGQKMNFLQKHSIDTLGVLFVCAVFVLILVKIIVYSIWKLLRAKKLKKEKVH